MTWRRVTWRVTVAGATPMARAALEQPALLRPWAETGTNSWVPYAAGGLPVFWDFTDSSRDVGLGCDCS